MMSSHSNAYLWLELFPPSSIGWAKTWIPWKCQSTRRLLKPEKAVRSSNANCMHVADAMNDRRRFKLLLKYFTGDGPRWLTGCSHWRSMPVRWGEIAALAIIGVFAKRFWPSNPSGSEQYIADLETIRGCLKRYDPASGICCIIYALLRTKAFRNLSTFSVMTLKIFEGL